MQFPRRLLEKIRRKNLEQTNLLTPDTRERSHLAPIL